MKRDANWGAVLLLFALGSAGASSSRAPSSRAPSPKPKPKTPPSTLPPGVDPVDDPELFNPEAVATSEDLLWLRFTGTQGRPGPPLGDDDKHPTPAARRLTAFERWALAPYFPEPTDLEIKIHNGAIPPELERLKNEWPDLLAAIAAKTTQSREIWFPKQRLLFTSGWLAAMAHEMVHCAQIRMGMTEAEAIDLVHKHGYVESPVEVQARDMQRRVLQGLRKQAAEYFK